jgi:beta-glucanase (GH16 family)
MRPTAILLCALLTLVATQNPVGAADWELVWSDEFSGSSLDPAKWDPQIGTGCPSLCGWGNNELQYYRAENATVANGMLTIEAREEFYGGRNYTSARLRTLGRADWLYGRFEMRAKLPTGKGLWPAFWMLPSDSIYGVWAASGEIDIMEIKGSQPNRVSGTIHFGGSWPENTFAGQSTTLASGDFGDDFHVFAVEWEPTELRWYLDGRLYATQTNWWSNGQPFPAPFDEDFHLLLNVAVGGNYDGNPGPADLSDRVRLHGSRPAPLERLVPVRRKRRWRWNRRKRFGCPAGQRVGCQPRSGLWFWWGAWVRGRIRAQSRHGPDGPHPLRDVDQSGSRSVLQAGDQSAGRRQR